MAHWFHRNPLKATVVQTFDSLRAAAKTSDTNKLLTDLKLARDKLLVLLRSPEKSVDEVTSAAEHYFSLLRGLIDPVAAPSADEEAAGATSSGESKLRKFLVFKWTDTLLGKEASSSKDAQFEFASMLFNFGLWFTKHSAKVAASSAVSMEEAKEVHKTLRIAAGIFKYIEENEVSRLSQPAAKTSDLDERIIQTYTLQCQAEAQEVTLARAIELKHKNNLISGLATETAKMFLVAADTLNSLDELLVAKWQRYLQLKNTIYKSYAYCFLGLAVLEEEKCGQAIRCLQESKMLAAKAATQCREYSKTIGPGTSAKPADHPFFLRLMPMVQKALDKCERENGFIYFQKVPEAAPQLDYRATHGLVEPEPYSVPALSAAWSPKLYQAFDKSKFPDARVLAAADGDKSKGDKEEIPPVPEPNVSTDTAYAKTQSGCVLS